MRQQAETIKTIISASTRIVVLQADNPDADSLGSALALEHLLGDMGKSVYLYCAIDMPSYLRYLAGWDRVSNELPTAFDTSIIVDASTMTLFEKLEASGNKGWISSKPCIVLDHHKEVTNTIPFATVSIVDPSRSSAGEVIYHLAKELEWPMSTAAGEAIMTSILGDTQGLSNNLASPGTYRAMAALLELGVNRTALEERRREYAKMPPTIFKYKADLITRTQLLLNGALALVTIPQAEITAFSPLYNPGPLIQGDMLQTTGVAVAMVLKQYSDGKITAAIRCNPTAPVGALLAEHFGGGGHDYASGFKISDGRSLETITSECTSFLETLLSQHHQGASDETI